MRKTVIIFNGKPKSGKDTLAKYLMDNFFDDMIHLENKSILIKQCCAIADIDIEEWNTIYNNYKDIPWDKLNGLTSRQFLIYVAEKVVKKVLGKDFYGKYLSKEISKSDNKLFVITDGGFKEELFAILNNPKIYRVILFRINRDNIPKIKDSRKDLSKIKHDKLRVYKINNNTSIQETSKYLNRIINDEISNNYFDFK
jgi:hypothetical protein